MLIKRPSIYIYVNRPDKEVLREICAGIEEEGVFFEVIEREGQKLESLTHEAAKDSMLGSGVGIEGSRTGFQIKGLESGKYIFYYEEPSHSESRILGMNSARAVKKQPFKEQDEV